METQLIKRKMTQSLWRVLIKCELLLAPKIYDLIPASRRANYPCADHILLAAPGNGNIGDQAMLDSFLENVRGTVTVVVRDSQDVHIDPLEHGRVRMLELEGMVYGSLLRHLVSISSFKALLKDSKSVSIVGADTMDGAYNLLASVRRSNISYLAAKLGVDTRVLGFSLNSNPTSESLSALKRASDSGVKLLLRDPVSFQRGLKLGLSNAVESADIVFSSNTARFPELECALNPNSRLALVNISAHIQNKVDQISDYIDLVRHLISSGFEVRLLPHVSRPGSDDIDLALTVEKSVRMPDVVAVRNLLSPSEIRGLCSRADIIITGRMHLSVIGLSQGVPCIILASQGKVEGLVHRFSRHAVEVEPHVGMKDVIIPALDKLSQDSDPSNFHDQIRYSRDLSNNNFASLNAVV